MIPFRRDASEKDYFLSGSNVLLLPAGCLDIAVKSEGDHVGYHPAVVAEELKPNAVRRREGRTR
jgi:hypothetical protein